MDLYSDDQLLATADCEQFTLDPYQQMSQSNPDSGFELFSDRKVRKFPGYELKPNGCLAAKKETPTINFDQLKSLLLSTDKSKMEEYLNLISGDLKFLDKKTPLGNEKVAFSSFCRTGNSFSRKMMEQITGVFSGADMPLMMSQALQQHGLLGEQT